MTLLSICSIVFKSRRIVGKMWRNVKYSTNEDKAVAFEKMIEECKKSSLRICMDYLSNQYIVCFPKQKAPARVLF